MTTHTKELILKDSDFPLLTETIINQVGIEKAGNDIPFFRLIQLKTALDALQPTPPNATTVWFDDTILLQSSTIPSPPNLYINPTNFTFSDTKTYRIGDTNGLSTLDIFADSVNSGTSYATLGSDTLYFNFNLNCNFNGNNSFIVNTLTSIILNSQSGTTELGDVNGNTNKTKLSINDSQYQINSDAIMNTAYNYAYILPICYTHKMSNSFSYIGVNNTWQNVYQDVITNIPIEFFSPNNTFWDYKIEFSINLRSMSNTSDKGLALYFEILDSNSVVYTPFLFNQPTPFTRHSNSSTYNATSSDMLTFTWTDTISFNSSVAPQLSFSLWWYGDQNNAPNFDAVLSLTRTNLV